MIPLRYTLKPAVVPPPEVHERLTCPEVLVPISPVGTGGTPADWVLIENELVIAERLPARPSRERCRNKQLQE
jgi:hypothetical protein